jgi:hypothetical protein
MFSGEAVLEGIKTSSLSYFKEYVDESSDLVEAIM